MKDKSTVSIVRRIYRQFQQGDLPGILGALSQDVAWIVHGPQAIPYGGIWIGKANVQKWFGLLSASVDMQRFEPHVLTSCDRYVTVTGREEALARSTGKSFNTQWCHLWTIHAGKVVQFEDYFDTARVRDAFAK